MATKEPTTPETNPEEEMEEDEQGEEEFGHVDEYEMAGDDGFEDVEEEEGQQEADVDDDEGGEGEEEEEEELDDSRSGAPLSAPGAPAAGSEDAAHAQEHLPEADSPGGKEPTAETPAAVDLNAASKSGDVAADRPSGSVPESTTAASAPAPATGDVDLKQLEAQASKVAQDMQNAAMEMSTKLSASFKSALGGLSSSEPPTLSKLAGGLASWWSSLDPPAQPQRNETAERVQASSKATSELQELFSLLPEENLVESFKCKLLQTYGCSHNTFTPAIQMAFQGTMYITDKHTCFSVEERARKLPFKILHTDIVKAERHRPQRKGDLSDVLRLDLAPGTSGDQSQQFLAFKDFESGGALDSALALVEHLMDGS